MQFEFATATRVVFGAGAIDKIGLAAKQIGSRALVVTGKNTSRASRLIALLGQAGIETAIHSIASEPTTDDARAGARRAMELGAQLVVAFGGGAALDAGKAISALATNKGDPLDYLEVVGKGLPLEQPPLPCLAIPTTAGTGSEVTRNAVLTSPEHRVKASMRHPLMLPRLALVDPELTLSAPPSVTASTGLDALTQLIEPFVSRRANPLTDALCREGMQRVARSLVTAFERGDDLAARTDMALGSLFGGMALANAGLGAAHGFAAVLGGSLGAPHGALCARLLGPVMEANVRALQARGTSSELLERHHEVARMLTGRADATAADAIAWIEGVCERLLVPRLAHHGLQSGALGEVVTRASEASSMKANPVALTPQELAGVLERAL